MKVQAGKTGKGAAGQKKQWQVAYVTPEERARKQVNTMIIAARKPGQRAGMAATRAKAKKKK